VVVTITAAALATLSSLLTLWQWLLARRFPLHQRVEDRSWAPAVTLLKPLKGRDLETERCLRSWLEQDYAGPMQVLFGVASEEDPVCALVRELIQNSGTADAELVICAEQLGPNGKISTLVQLQRGTKHDIVVVSDADVRIPNDLLINLVAPLRNSQTGLVNCFYRLANPVTPAMQCEAVAVNADFWSQVLQARSLRNMDFALGAVMATTRARLKSIGGFEPLLEYLADDFQLGRRIATAGGHITLCPVPVECWSAPMGWSEVWSHQLRWARTIRICQPLPFFFSILGNATLWPLVWVVISPGIL
jgi:ceramide glucosyltransferase